MSHNNSRCLLCFKELKYLPEQQKESLFVDLHVIFTLRNLLEVPDQVLLNFGQNPDEPNPADWVRLCASCKQGVDVAKEIHEKIIHLTNEFKTEKLKIIEICKGSRKAVDYLGLDPREPVSNATSTCRDFVDWNVYDSAADPCLKVEDAWTFYHQLKASASNSSSENVETAPGPDDVEMRSEPEDSSSDNDDEFATGAETTPQLGPNVEAKLLHDMSFIVNGRFNCVFCGRDVSTRCQIFHHLRREHGEYLKCGDCGEVYLSLLRLDKHRWMSAGHKKPCKDCFKEFDTMDETLQHMTQVHKKSFVGYCEVCNSPFVYDKSLKCHMVRQHNEDGRYNDYLPLVTKLEEAKARKKERKAKKKAFKKGINHNKRYFN